MTLHECRERELACIQWEDVEEERVLQEDTQARRKTGPKLEVAK
jgi:hypothetical protein